MTERKSQKSGRYGPLFVFTRKYKCLERFPIAWTHVIDKEPLQSKMLEQVLIEKVCQLFL